MCHCLFPYSWIHEVFLQLLPYWLVAFIFSLGHKYRFYFPRVFFFLFSPCIKIYFSSFFLLHSLEVSSSSEPSFNATIRCSRANAVEPPITVAITNEIFLCLFPAASNHSRLLITFLLLSSLQTTTVNPRRWRLLWTHLTSLAPERVVIWFFYHYSSFHF